MRIASNHLSVVNIHRNGASERYCRSSISQNSPAIGRIRRSTVVCAGLDCQFPAGIPSPLHSHPFKGVDAGCQTDRTEVFQETMQNVVRNHIHAVDPQSSPIVSANSKRVNTWSDYAERAGRTEDIVISATAWNRVIESPVAG